MIYETCKNGNVALSPQVVVYRVEGADVKINDAAHAEILKGAGVIRDKKSQGAAPENKMIKDTLENKGDGGNGDKDAEAQALKEAKEALIEEGVLIGLKLTKTMKPETMRKKIDAKKAEIAKENSDK